MQTKDYDNYIRSEEWKRKRKERLKIDNYKCVMCGSGIDQWGYLEVHHISYKNMGHEDVWNDLCTLCPSCHKLIHAYYRRPRKEVI